jgi:hypothetical protein
VQKDTGTGSESERVKLRLMVSVEGVEYDAEGGWARCGAALVAPGLVISQRRCAVVACRCALSTGAPPASFFSLTVAPSAFLSSSNDKNTAGAGQQIRIKGRNLTENEHVKLGAYHTLELELQRAFTLHKVRVCAWWSCFFCLFAFSAFFCISAFHFCIHAPAIHAPSGEGKGCGHQG